MNNMEEKVSDGLRFGDKLMNNKKINIIVQLVIKIIPQKMHCQLMYLESTQN